MSIDIQTITIENTRVAARAFAAAAAAFGGYAPLALADLLETDRADDLDFDGLLRLARVANAVAIVRASDERQDIDPAQLVACAGLLQWGMVTLYGCADGTSTLIFGVNVYDDGDDGEGMFEPVVRTIEDWREALVSLEVRRAAALVVIDGPAAPAVTLPGPAAYATQAAEAAVADGAPGA